MAADVQDWGAWGRLLALVDLLDKCIDRLACLDCHVLVLFQQEVVQLVEQVDIVLGRYQVPLQDLEHEDLVLGHWLALAQRVDHIADHLFLEGQQVRGTQILVGLGVLGVLEEFLDGNESVMGEAGTYIIREKKREIR